MNPSYLVKNLPVPLQGLVRPMLLISAGLHGAVLLMPMPAKPKHETVKKPAEKVKITQLPTSSSPPAPKTSIKPSPKVALAPSPKPSPVVHKQIPQLIARVNQPIIRQPQPVKSLAPRPTTTPLSKPTPTPNSAPTPVATATPTPNSAPMPVATATSTPEPTTTPTPINTPPSTAEDPFADFPRYPNSQSGSLGVLPPEADKSANHTEDKLDQVVTYFSTQLQAKQFSIQPSTDEADAKIYQVAKGNTTQYLHLISRQEKTVIVLAPQPLDLEQLKHMEVEQQTPEERAFDDILVKVDQDLVLAALDNGLSDLVEADKFAQEPNVKLERILGTTKNKTPDELVSYLQGKLGEQGFSLSQVGTYGGGPLYKVTNGAFTRYLCLVPTQNSRTAILSLKDSPVQ